MSIVRRLWSMPSWKWAFGSWLAVKAIHMALWTAAGLGIQGDVMYYYNHTSAHWAGTPLSETLVEYPTPVVWILMLPLMIPGAQYSYLFGFILMTWLLDAAFAIALWRTGGGHRVEALRMWLVFVLLMGPLLYMRFDVLPSVLVGAAILVNATRPALAGSLLGWGAATKLWPAALLPTQWTGEGNRIMRSLAGALGTGAALVALSLIFGGWDRLISPLAWQSDRGLQVESVAATPAMLSRIFFGDHQIGMAFNAYEVFGPLTGPMLTLSSIVTVVGFALIVAGAVVWVRRGRGSLPGVLLLLAVVTVLVVGNKALSPQYMIWLGAPLAAALALRGQPHYWADGEDAAEHGAALRSLAMQLLLITALTQLVYPLTYSWLVHDHPLTGVAAAILAVRNVLLVVFAVSLGRTLWRTLSAPTGGRDRPVTKSQPDTPAITGSGPDTIGTETA